MQDEHNEQNEHQGHLGLVLCTDKRQSNNRLNCALTMHMDANQHMTPLKLKPNAISTVYSVEKQLENCTSDKTKLTWCQLL